MAKKFLTVSDLSGQPVEDEEVVSMVVLDHPVIDNPVQLDISSKEADGLDIEQDDYVILELVSDGGDKRERVVMQAKKFDAMFGDNVDEVLAGAEKYELVPSRRAPEPEPKRRQTARSATEKVNYKELPNAGLPHRGRTTAEEAEVVRNNLEAVNRNRVAAGHKPIDPRDEKDAARYGFDQMADKDLPTLSPEFKA